MRHLLLAPIRRRDVLTRPVFQRLGALAFGGALVGAIGGQLAARRLPGSPAAWTASVGAAGAATAAAFVAVAVLAHVARVPRWLATTLAGVVLAAQAGAVAGWWPGLCDTIGSLALWGMRQEPVDLIGAAVVVALSVVALALAGRLLVEPLVRRADLVSQLRFAVTMQDLRTVVLVRRQLRGERPRSRPWARRQRPPRARGGHAAVHCRVVWQRGWRGLLRYPLSRLVRMAMLAIAAGLAAVAVLRGTTPAIVAVGIALFLLGLDAVEPLSQEIDHPDHTDAVPRARGWLLAHHVAAPAVALVPFAMLGAGRDHRRAVGVGRGAGPLRPGHVGRRVRRRHQRRAGRARPAGTARRLVGGRAAEFAGFTSTLRSVAARREHAGRRRGPGGA